MTPRHTRGLVERIRNESERALSAQEVLAQLAVPIADDERESVLALVRWFRRRYPQPADRLGYVRRAYARWLDSRDKRG